MACRSGQHSCSRRDSAAHTVAAAPVAYARPRVGSPVGAETDAAPGPLLPAAIPAARYRELPLCPPSEDTPARLSISWIAIPLRQSAAVLSVTGCCRHLGPSVHHIDRDML